MEILFKKSTNHLVKNLPFVLYAKPNSSKIIGLFQNDTTCYSTTLFTEKGFVFTSFDTTKKIILPLDKVTTEIAEILPNLKTSKQNITKEIIPAEKIAFKQLVAKTVATIKENKCSKIVVSRKKIIPNTTINSIATFKQMLHSYPTAFRYLFFHPKVGLWLGATPEQLINIKNNTVTTVALAGTKTNYDEKWGKKEQEEQQIVTNYITNSLKNTTTNIKETTPFTAKAGKLFHIKTTISATILKNSTLNNIITSLHPTPAVCGVPKKEATQFILDNENYDRAFYTGFIGELNYNFENKTTEQSDLFVNLRCLQQEKNKLSIYVGCGITANSNAEKEFIETENKSSTMQQIVIV